MSDDLVDDLVINPGRMRILTSLAERGSLEFVSLRSATRLTDGNLASHTRRLSAAGLVAVDKQFRASKPVTTIGLTRAGRDALERHIDRVTRSIRSPIAAGATAALLDNEPVDDDWID